MERKRYGRRRFLGSLAVAAGAIGVTAGGKATSAAASSNSPHTFELTNRNLALTIDASRGSITAIHNKLTGERHQVESVEFAVLSDRGTLSSSQMRVVHIASEPERLVLDYQSEGWKATLHYELGESWVEKWAALSCRQPALLHRIVLGDRKFSPAFREIYAHSDNTAYDIPINWFLRTERGGWYTGVEYPYVAAERPGKGLRLAMGGWKAHYDLSNRVGFPDMAGNRPSITELQPLNVQLQAGETFTTEKEFLGVFRQTGLYRDKALVGVPRIITTNPERLDWGEVWAMQDFMRHVMPVLPRIQDDFELYMNGWWAGLPGGAITSKDLPAYKNATDVSVETGAKVFAFSPTWVGMAEFFKRSEPFVETVGENLHFELSAPAKEAVAYVESRGLTLAPYCEPASHYRQDRPDWKLVHEDGKKSEMLCWANPAAIDWFLALHREILDRYKSIKYWGWDGGWLAGEPETPTADGQFSWVCQAANHQHPPGNIAYTEYQQVMSFFRRFRMQRRYVGTIVAWAVKSGGPWAQRYLDSHENYYENQGPDDLRFQMWYNQNSNFLPAEKNMAQIWFKFTPSAMKLADNTRDYWKAWFTPGTRDYRYGMMSALSGGSNLGYIVQLPKFDAESDKREYFAFMSKWTKWATANLGCLQIKRDIFGQPLRKDGIDGSAHCVDDHGFIFIFNPTAGRHIGRIGLDDRIRITARRMYEVRVIYPESGSSLGSYEYGGQLLVDMPAGECKLLEIAPHAGGPIPPLVPTGADIQDAF